MDIKFDQQYHDIVLESVGGLVDLSLVESAPDILMQRLFLRLKTYPKDLFWNINFGIDYLHDIFGKNKPKDSVDAVIRNEILKEPLVLKIDSFESEVKNYNYACKFTVKSKNIAELLTYYILTNEVGLILTDENGDTLTTLL